jgi:hypothetical protein
MEGGRRRMHQSNRMARRFDRWARLIRRGHSVDHRKIGWRLIRLFHRGVKHGTGARLNRGERSGLSLDESGKKIAHESAIPTYRLRR